MTELHWKLQTLLQSCRNDSVSYPVLSSPHSPFSAHFCLCTGSLGPDWSVTVCAWTLFHTQQPYVLIISSKRPVWVADFVHLVCVFSERVQWGAHVRGHATLAWMRPSLCMCLYISSRRVCVLRQQRTSIRKIMDQIILFASLLRCWGTLRCWFISGADENHHIFSSRAHTVD